MKACLVVYDIPTGAKVASPGKVFRPVGVRINLSCWVVPHQLIPWDYLKEITGKGAKSEVVRFDEDEAPNIRRMAEDALRTEVHEIYKSFNSALARAKDWVAPVEAGVDPGEKRELKVKIALQRAKRHLRFAQEAAIAFELLADVQELIKGRSEAVASEFESFFATAQASAPVRSKAKSAVKSESKKAKAKAKAKSVAA